MVKIEKGARDYQVFQQKDGFCDITLSGVFTREGETDNFVLFRVFRERDMTDVTGWIFADVASDGKYTVTLSDIPAGGPYGIESVVIENKDFLWGTEWGRAGDRIRHIGVGDIYVIAGQSNAVGYGKTIFASEPDMNVRLYSNSENWEIATDPLGCSMNSVHPINAEPVNTGTGPYISFAKELNAVLGYPIGLIQTALGGSPISLWQKCGEENLYSNMIRTVKHTTDKVAGILWYQGCSDTAPEEAIEKYPERFEKFVKDAREDLGDPALPILTCQLNRVLAKNGDIAPESYGRIREIQRAEANKLDGVYIVPTYDLPISDNIHNSSVSNAVIGQRLAYLALERIYGKRYRGTAPDIAYAKYEKDCTVTVGFSNIYSYITENLCPVELMNFVFCDDDGEIALADYVRRNDREFGFKLARKPKGRLFVSNVPHLTAHSFPIFDRSTSLPVLAFYKFPVEM